MARVGSPDGKARHLLLSHFPQNAGLNAYKFDIRPTSFKCFANIDYFNYNGKQSGYNPAFAAQISVRNCPVERGISSGKSTTPYMGSVCAHLTGTRKVIACFNPLAVVWERGGRMEVRKRRAVTCRQESAFSGCSYVLKHLIMETRIFKKIKMHFFL